MFSIVHPFSKSISMHPILSVFIFLKENFLANRFSYLLLNQNQHIFSLDSHQILHLASSLGSVVGIYLSSSSGMYLHLYSVIYRINCEPNHNEHILHEKMRQREKMEHNIC